jgi:hypothetical protein
MINQQKAGQALQSFMSPNLFTLKLELFEGECVVAEPILHFWPQEPFAIVTFPDGRVVGMRTANVKGYTLTPHKQPEEPGV